jgi:hypothetical protein
MRGRRLIAMLGIVFLWLAAGCTVATQMSVTGRSGLEQQLLFRSLERAVAQLDIQRFPDGPITVELIALTDSGTQTFAEQFVRARLKERGLRVVAEEKDAKVKLQIFASMLGTDQNETLIGLPSLPTPVGFSLPELAVYKVTQNQGRTELQTYAFHPQTGEFISEAPISFGRANYTQYKILAVINFTLNDLEK